MTHAFLAPLENCVHLGQRKANGQVRSHRVYVCFCHGGELATKVGYFGVKSAHLVAFAVDIDG